MAHHLADDGILAFSLNPGGIKSELTRDMGSFGQWLLSLVLFPTPMGAINQLYAGTSTDLTIKDSGKYFIPWARAHPPAKGVQDPALADKLWNFLEEDTAGKY
jgi:retinol dehydrogenase 12